jgi:hypothetical protein
MHQDTLNTHWGKHHRTYVTNLNNQIKDKPLANKTLHEVTPKRTPVLDAPGWCASTPASVTSAARWADHCGLLEQRQAHARVQQRRSDLQP